MPLKNWCSIHARCFKSSLKYGPYVSVAFFPSLKQNFIANRSSYVSSRPDCIFEFHQLLQSGFSRVYSNSCCSCSFEREIIKSLVSNLIRCIAITYYDNFRWLYKKVWKPTECTTHTHTHAHTHTYIYIYIYIPSYSYLSIYLFIYEHIYIPFYSYLTQTHTHTHTLSLSLSLSLSLYIYIYIYIYIYMYAHSHYSFPIYLSFYLNK